MRFLVLVTTLGALACGGGKDASPDDTDDADGDGIVASDDCDDDDPDVGLPETWYADVDTDGYGDPDTGQDACDPPEGHTDVGTDCDDTDGLVNPGADEVCGDGKDNNCDGTPTPCAPWGDDSIDAADHVIWGASDGDRFGEALALVGDTDGDGASELFVGDRQVDSAGGAYLFTTPLAVDTGADDALAFLSDSSSLYAGRSVESAGDTDGDGYPELVVGAPITGGGVAYVVRTPVAGVASLADADAMVIGGATNDRLGFRVAGGDLDGDGLGDIAVGAPGWDPDHSEDIDNGAAFVYLGPVSGRLDQDAADLSLLAADEGDTIELGYTIALGDLDGDGLADLIAGAGDDDTAGTGRGAVYLVHGPTTGLLNRDDVDDRVVGSDLEEECGRGVGILDDIDGDGVDDLAVGCPYAGDEAGRLFVVPGTVTGTTDASAALFQVESTGSGDLLGYEVASGDVDDDGRMDIILCSQDAGASDGAAWLFYGPLSGTLMAEDADHRLRGTDTQAVGTSCVLGDVNADGVDDVVVGASMATHGSDTTGAVFVFVGGGI